LKSGIKAVRSLVDERIEELGKKKSGAGRKKMTKVEVD
jgi:hypothetical protein